MSRDRHVQNHRFFKVSFPPYENNVSWYFWALFQKIASKFFLAIFYVSKMTFLTTISRKSTF